MFRKIRTAFLKLVHYLRPPRREETKKPVCQPLQTSALLRLPVETLVEMFDDYPSHTLAILAQTCFALRVIIKEHYPHRLERMLQCPERNLRFLRCLSYNRLDVFVCPWCRRLRTVQFDDWPTHTHGDRPLSCCNRSNHRQPPGPCILAHRHVQLALKYTRLRHRLNHTEADYLYRLVAPSYEFLAPMPPPYHRTGPDARVVYWMKPKVVSGRFLTMREYGWVGADWVDSLSFLICDHQVSMSLAWFSDNPSWCALLPNVFADGAVVEMQTSCRYCPTDVSLTVYQTTYVVRIWQDYGAETTLIDRHWTALTHMTAWIGSEPRRHGPGKVRRLYESEGVNIPRLGEHR